MGKKVDDTVLDGALNIIKNGATRMVACSAEPANYAGIAAVALADATMASTDFTVANGDTSGRKVTVAAKSSVLIDTSGTATHVVLHDNVSVLHYVTTCTSQALTANGSNTVNFPAWDIEIADPT